MNKFSRLSRVVVFLLVAAFLAAGCAGSGSKEGISGNKSTKPESSSFTLGGTILINDAGFSEVTVSISGDASGVAITGVDGKYSINLPNGNYVVTPSKSGYTFDPESLTVNINGGNGGASFSATKNWQVMQVNSTASNMINFTGVCGISNSDVFVAGYTHVDFFKPAMFYLDKGGWFQDPNISSTSSRQLLAVWACSTSVFSAGTDGLIMKMSGGSWEVIAEGEVDADIKSIWGTSESDVYFAGSGFLGHYNGVKLDYIDTGTSEDFQTIWGSDPENVFVGGDNGTIYYYNSISKTGYFFLINPNYQIKGIWGSSSKNVFAIGEDISTGNGFVLNYNGSGWDVIYPGVNGVLNAIWGFSGKSVVFYIVGNDGLIIKYNNGNWTILPPQTNQNLNAVWGNSSSDIYAAGDMGTVIHFKE